MSGSPVDPDLAELQRFWRELDEDGQHQVLWTARSAAAARASGAPRLSALINGLA